MTLPKKYCRCDIMELPKRKSPRICGYDYSLPNYYFITICTHSKKCIFGKPNQLNAYGSIAENCLKEIEKVFPFIVLDKYVVMPNHIHGIFVIEDETGKQNLTTVLAQYKMSVTKKIRKIDPKIVVWQRSFHDHIIRNQASYEKIWMYIEDNPRKWDEDCFYCTDSDE